MYVVYVRDETETTNGNTTSHRALTPQERLALGLDSSPCALAPPASPPFSACSAASNRLSKEGAGIAFVGVVAIGWWTAPS